MSSVTSEVNFGDEDEADRNELLEYDLWEGQFSLTSNNVAGGEAAEDEEDEPSSSASSKAAKNAKNQQKLALSGSLDLDSVICYESDSSETTTSNKRQQHHYLLNHQRVKNGGHDYLANWQQHVRVTKHTRVLHSRVFIPRYNARLKTPVCLTTPSYYCQTQPEM